MLSVFMDCNKYPMGRGGLTVMALVSLLLLAPGVWAQEPSQGEKESLPDFSRQGVDSCLRCHDDDKTAAIFQTAHGLASNPHAPFAQQQCESCHGPGGDHAGRLRPGQQRPAPLAFASEALLSKPEQVDICLSCHQGQERGHWQGSVHERQDVGCTDCHSVHNPRDPVQVREQQPAVCYQCHQTQRAQSFQASSHPIRQGKMACTECHQAHGSLTDDMLAATRLNNSCTECHAEKRGPFLWEHAPVAEDCSLCHEPHGSNHQALLTRRAPLLCQECHARAGHPSIAQTGERLPEGRPSAFLLGGSCTNCHSQVHGSNHPSGGNLSR